MICWRIFGIIFSKQRHFLNPDKKVFDKERIIDLLNKKGIALYDTASAVRRLQDNASDKISGSCRTDRYQFATEADSNVQGHCNHRTKSNGLLFVNK